MNHKGPLRLAIPSDGEMHQPTLSFLAACGLAVERNSARRYTAAIPSLGGTLVLFQRAADIPQKVEEGSADLGVAGLDRFAESAGRDGDAAVVVADLGYSRCELVLAVPDAWVDVTSVADIADLAVEFRERGRSLRVATKYPRVVQGFLASRGVPYSTLVPSSGTLEAAPAMGFADMIADISSSGTTLRENGLKTLVDGTILRSQACLVGNRRQLRGDPARQEMARRLVQQVEGYVDAGRFLRVTAVIGGTSAEAVARSVTATSAETHLANPAVAPVFTPEGEPLFAVSVVVAQGRVQQALDHLRSLEGSDITVEQPRFFYRRGARAFDDFLSGPSEERGA